MNVNPIGVVRNGIRKRPEEWKDIRSEIHVREDLAEGLEGLEDFSHVLIVFSFHVSEPGPLKVHPKGREDLPVVGVFSTRAPVRPNFIGVSVVELVERRGNMLKVKGLDAFDGTPVLDIKPHISSPTPTRVADWVEK